MEVQKKRKEEEKARKKKKMQQKQERHENLIMNLEDFDIDLKEEGSKVVGPEHESEEYSIISSDGGESFYRYPKREQEQQEFPRT